MHEKNTFYYINLGMKRKCIIKHAILTFQRYMRGISPLKL